METPSESSPLEPTLPPPVGGAVEGAVHAAPAKRPRRSVLVWITAVCTCGIVALGTWCSYWAELRNDQYQLINLGRCIYDGGRLYVDCWENKPPGIAWINALGVGLSGGGQTVVWLLPGLTALLSLLVAGYAVARVLSRAAACVTVLLASVVWSLRLYDTPSINPDFYSATMELAACSLWVLSLDTSRRLRRVSLGVAAGLAWAAAVTFKQTGLVGLLAVSLFAVGLVVAKRGEYRRWAVATLFSWVGFVVGLGVVAAVLANRQTLGEAWEAIFVFNRELAGSDAACAAARQWFRAQAGLTPLQLPLWLGLVGIVATLHTGRANRLSRVFALAMMLWWVAQVLLALLGPSQSMRYWQATFPAMLWLAAMGIDHLAVMFDRLDRSYRLALAVICATVVVVLGRPLVDHYVHGMAESYLACSADKTERDRLSAIGMETQIVVPEGQAIYVWAYDAGVYVYAARPQASRFTYPRSAEQMQEILSDLSAGEAYALLIPQNGSPAFDRWCDDACQEQLSETLASHKMKADTGGYQVWTPNAE